MKKDSQTLAEFLLCKDIIEEEVAKKNPSLIRGAVRILGRQAGVGIVVDMVNAAHRAAFDWLDNQEIERRI